MMDFATSSSSVSDLLASQQLSMMSQIHASNADQYECSIGVTVRAHCAEFDHQGSFCNMRNAVNAYLTRSDSPNSVMMEASYPCSYPALAVLRVANSNQKASFIENFTFSLHQIPMSTAIYQRRYDIIQGKLAHPSNGEDPNEEILFQNVYMTGLEYSVYNHDWKMAIMFYIHAADPKYNCFDGRAVGDRLNRIPDRNMYHLCENNGMPIAGFKGLYCLLNPTVPGYNGTLSALWLMEQCYIRKDDSHRLGSIKELNHARYCMDQIGAGTVWNKEFCQRVYTILHCLRRGDGDASSSSRNGDMQSFLPEEICLNILDFVVDDILLYAIWRGLMHASRCAAMKIIPSCEGMMDMDCS